MANGTDIVDLGVSIDLTPLAKGEQQLDSFGKKVDDAAKKVDGLTDAQKRQAKAAAELEKAGAALITKLQQSIDTFGMGAAQLQRYQAAQLGVGDEAEALIGKLERLNAAQNNASEAQQRHARLLANISKQRADEERAAAAAAEARMSAEERRVAEAKSRHEAQLAQIVATRKALSDAHEEAIRDNAAFDAERRAALERQKANEIVFQAFKRRTMAENRAEANRILDQMAQDAIESAERQALEEIQWSRKSVNERIQELERLKAYQANPKIRRSTIDANFSQAAQNDLPNLEKYIGQVEQTNRATSHLLASTRSLVSQLRTLAFVSTSVVSAFGVRELIQVVDGYTKYNAQLKLATDSTKDYLQAQTEVQRIAKVSQTDLSATGILYARISKSTQELGLAQQQVSDITEAVNLSLRISAATAQESSSAMIQLSQAFAAGRLNGQEFNSVNEAAPRLMKAIADGIGVPVGALKEMASEGKLTADVLAFAIPKALEQMRKEAEQVKTIGGSFTLLRNEFMLWVGEIATSSGLIKGFTDLIKVMADNIGAVITGVATLIGMGLAAWLGGAVIAVGGFTAAITVATTAVRAFFLAMGPIGWLITALGAAATAWQLFGDKSKSAQQKAAAATTTSTNSILEDLNKQIAALKERNALARGEGPVPVTGMKQAEIATARVKEMERLRKEMEAAASGTGEYKKLDMQTRIGIAAKFGKEYSQLYSGVQQVNKELLEQQRIVKNQTTTKWMSELATKSEQLEAKLKKAREEFRAVGSELPAEIEKRIRDEFAEKKPKGSKGRKAKVDRDVTSEDISAYEQLMAAIRGTREELELEAKTGENATKVQRARIKLDQDLASGRLTLSEAQIIIARSELDVAAAIERKIEAAKQDAKLQEERLQQMIKAGEENTRAIENAEKEATANELKLAQMRDSKSVTEEATIARMEEQLAQMQSIGLCTAETEKLEALISAKKRNATALAGIEAIQGGEKAKKDLDKFLDPTKARKFGDSLRGAFKGAADALVNLTNVLGSYIDRQAEVEEGRRNNERAMDAGRIDEQEYYENRARLDKMDLQNKLSGYGAMADAAKGFFSENSSGYKMMDGIAKTFHTAQLAMNMVEMFMLAKKAVLTQAGGDPYTAWARMAAMAAAVATLGFAVGGGFNSGSAGSGAARREERQRTQGTGSVLGDSTAKSESIVKALEQVEKDTQESLGQNNDILEALRDINQSIGSLATVLIRNAGITTGSNMGIFEGQVDKGGGLIGALRNLWGKTTQSITDAGLFVNAKLGDLAQGQGVSQYADVQRTSSSWFGLVKKTSNSMQYSQADQAVADAMGRVVDNMIESLSKASESFNFDPDTVDAWFREWTTSGHISLKDMNGKEVEETLQAFFSRMGDDLASGLMGGKLDEFQRMGEGYYETFMRVASGIEQAEFALGTLGTRVLEYWYIADKQGDVGAGLVKASLKAQEFGTSLYKVMDNVNGTVEEIIEAYTGLVKARMQMDAMGMGRNLTVGAVRGAGGVANLNSIMSGYMTDMFSESEQTAMKTKMLREEFERLGFALPENTAAFKRLVTTLMAAGENGQMTAVQVMALSGAFVEIQDKAKDAGNALEKARSDLENAYDREVDRLEGLRDAFDAFGESLAGLRDSLMMGDLSTMSTADKYSAAKSKLDQMAALAKSGDEDAMRNYSASATEFLNLSRQFNASGTGYTADYEKVMSDIAVMESFAQSQESAAEQSLKALKQTVDHLLGIEENTLTIAQAISNFKFMQLTGGNTGVTHLDGSHANGLPYVPYNGYRAELHKGERVLTSEESRAYNANLSDYGKGANEALVQEIKGLREEVRQLKEEQRDQTKRLVVANYDSNSRNADAIVNGMDNCLSKSARKEAIKPTLS